MRKINRFTMYGMISLAFFLHIIMPGNFTLFGARPDLMIIPVIFFGLFLGPASGLEAGICSGLLKDIFALDFFGINIFIFAIIGIFSGNLGTKFLRESVRTIFLLTFLFTALSMIAHYILVLVFSKWLTVNLWEYIATSIIFTSLYTSILASVLFPRLIFRYNLAGQGEYL